MEVPRMLLALASKFPGAGYDDLRFGTEPKGSVLPYDSVKDSLGANLGVRKCLGAAAPPRRRAAAPHQPQLRHSAENRLMPPRRAAAPSRRQANAKPTPPRRRAAAQS